MPTTKDDSFIEDLHDASAWLLYYDTVIDSIWLLSVSRPVKRRFSRIISVLDELFQEKA